MLIHEQIVFMDQSTVVYVLLLTRTGVTVLVKSRVVNVVMTVAARSHFICRLLKSCFISMYFLWCVL